MALLTMLDHISQEMDCKNYSNGVFLDLSKAFDTIDHQILLQMLKMFGVRGTALKCFSSYITERTQCISVGDVLSKIFLLLHVGYHKGHHWDLYCLQYILMTLLLYLLN